jgi:deoxyribodipyrimidine photo-lyase
MKNFNSYRVFERNRKNVNADGDYVLYWMSINRRLEYNYALEYAVGWANKLGKPLLIYEGLSCDIPWASDRFHQFLIEGMHETQQTCTEKGINYYSYVEFNPQEGAGLVENLAKNAALVIADEFPVYIIRPYNRLMARKVEIPYITIDSNGIIPLGLTEKAPYSAYTFRMTMQRHFKDGYLNPPKESPLNDLKNRDKITLGDDFLSRWPNAKPLYDNIPETVSKLSIDHSVKALKIKGTREAALSEMHRFVENRLKNYGEQRNDPDLGMTSKLSGWLHYGKISEYEIVKAALEKQPQNWSIDDLRYNKGQRDGFFGGKPEVEAFLDEVITWREVGFHFCHHVPNYDKFDSLPDWAIQTLEEHAMDEREFVYSFEKFEKAQTHDEIWNAAQRQLVRDGVIHNYLRMLWGKKVLEWTEHPRVALAYLIELNNKYAIDGRDPNSYSGIFWVLGRFDRAWGPERPIYGKIRYMTSDSTAKKVKLKNYLKEFASF